MWKHWLKKKIDFIHEILTRKHPPPKKKNKSKKQVMLNKTDCNHWMLSIHLLLLAQDQK